MAIPSEVREEIIARFQKHPQDRGSSAVQVALLSRQIQELTEHLKRHPKDNHSRMGLLRAVGRRRRLLRYLSRSEPDAYRELMSALGLRG